VLERGRTLVDKLPIPRSSDVELKLHKNQRKVDRLKRLNEIYRPYGELDCVFDDRNARALLESLHPDDRDKLDAAVGVRLLPQPAQRQRSTTDTLDLVNGGCGRRREHAVRAAR